MRQTEKETKELLPPPLLLLLVTGRESADKDVSVSILSVCVKKEQKTVLSSSKPGRDHVSSS